VDDVYLILTKANGTPFSFFRYIFWNEEIDIRTTTGKQILQHELTHVRQKHSFDNIFLQLVVIFGWFNPFFWLLKKEMNMIHEFIADNKAVAEGDTASLAQMLLAAAYPQQSFSLSNPFFFSPIKRRLAMLTKTSNPRFSYLRRLVVLPLLCVVTVLFAFRNKEKDQPVTLSLANVVEQVVDDAKSLVQNNVQQPADSSLAAQGEKTVNDNGIKIAFSAKSNPLTYQFLVRDPFNNIGKSRKVFVKDALHRELNGEKKLVWEEIHETLADDQGIASIRIGQGKSTGKGSEDAYENIDWAAGNFFMNTRAAISPSVPYTWWRPEDNFIDQGTIQLRFPNGKPGNNNTINNATSFSQSLYPESPKQITTNILNLSSNSKGDTVPAKGVIVAKTVPIEGFNLAKEATLQNKLNTDSVLYILGGKEITKTELEKIDPALITSVHVLKDNNAVALYGEKGRKGVIEIRLKEIPYAMYGHVTAGDKKLFTEVEKPASFPGGEEAWRVYLFKHLNLDLPVQKGAGPGTYKVELSFVVAEDGTISNVEALNDPGYGTKEEAVRLMKDGHKWMPAEQNGKKVLSLTKKSITFIISEE
jgi:hypothetical protein